jgi:hypothetical protein
MKYLKGKNNKDKDNKSNKSKKIKTNITYASDDDDQDESNKSFCTMKIVAAQRKGLLHKYDILCDDESSISSFYNKDLVSNIRTVSERIEVFGIGGSLTVDMMGDLPGFGSVYFHRSSRKYIMLLRPDE